MQTNYGHLAGAAQVPQARIFDNKAKSGAIGVITDVSIASNISIISNFDLPILELATKFVLNRRMNIGRTSVSAARKDAFGERLPNEVEIKNAEQLRTIIASQLKSDDGAQISLAESNGEVKTITLSPALAESFMEVLRLVSTGRGFRMIPVDAELTSQEAADCLNVSRPYLVKLLENGDIPHVKTGRHRKVKASELFAYKHKRDDSRSAALSDLAAMDAEYGLI